MKRYYDERDFYITEDELKTEFDNFTEDEKEIYNYSFAEYIKECTSKNGTLTEVK